MRGSVGTPYSGELAHELAGITIDCQVDPMAFIIMPKNSSIYARNSVQKRIELNTNFESGGRVGIDWKPPGAICSAAADKPYPNQKWEIDGSLAP